MPNALIYSPGFDGHRQVYVFVVAHVLKKLGYKIYIAGNTKQIITNSFYIDSLNKSLKTKIIDTSRYDEGGINITPAEFLESCFFICFTTFQEEEQVQGQIGRDFSATILLL